MCAKIAARSRAEDHLLDFISIISQIRPRRLRAASRSINRTVEDDNDLVRSIAFGCSSPFVGQKEE